MTRLSFPCHEQSEQYMRDLIISNENTSAHSLAWANSLSPISLFSLVISESLFLGAVYALFISRVGFLALGIIFSLKFTFSWDSFLYELHELIQFCNTVVTIVGI